MVNNTSVQLVAVGITLIACIMCFYKKYPQSILIEKVPTQWDEEKEKLDYFWKTYFDVRIPWKKLTIPKIPSEGENTHHYTVNTLEFVPEGITLERVLEVFKKLYPTQQFCQYRIPYKIIEYEHRKSGPRLIRHYGLQNPDNHVLHKGPHTMLPVETLIAALRFQTETGRKYDETNITVFNAKQQWLNEDGSIRHESDMRMDDIFRMPGVYCQDGRILISNPEKKMKIFFRSTFL